MAASFGIGLALFAWRQSIERDDGFIAVTLAKVTGKVDEFSKEAVEGTEAVIRIFTVFIMVSVFWALFDQHSSSWIRQGQMMDLGVDFGFWAGELLPSQIQSLNPLMVMALIPINMFGIYPLLSKLIMGVIIIPYT